MLLHWSCTLCLLEALGSFVLGVIGWRRGCWRVRVLESKTLSFSLCAVAKERRIASSRSTWSRNRSRAEKSKFIVICTVVVSRGRHCNPWIGLSAVDCGCALALREEGLKLGGETGAFFSSLGLLFKTTIFLPPSPLRSTNLAPPTLSSFGPFDIFLGLAAPASFFRQTQYPSGISSKWLMR